MIQFFVCVRGKLIGNYYYYYLVYRLIAYEKFNNGSVSMEMRVIISSQNLYFFEDSPPDLSSLDTQIRLEQLAECRATTAKTSNTFIILYNRHKSTCSLIVLFLTAHVAIPTVLLVLSVREKEEGGGGGGAEGAIIMTKKYKCVSESNAKKV